LRGPAQPYVTQAHQTDGQKALFQNGNIEDHNLCVKPESIAIYGG
jgi:hypothetical protein